MIKGRESNGDDVGCTSYVGMVNQRFVPHIGSTVYEISRIKLRN